MPLQDWIPHCPGWVLIPAQQACQGTGVEERVPIMNAFRRIIIENAEALMSLVSPMAGGALEPAGGMWHQ